MQDCIFSQPEMPSGPNFVPKMVQIRQLVLTLGGHIFGRRITDLYIVIPGRGRAVATVETYGKKTYDKKSRLAISKKINKKAWGNRRTA